MTWYSAAFLLSNGSVTHFLLSLLGLCLWASVAILLISEMLRSVWTKWRSKSGTPSGLPTFPPSTGEISKPWKGAAKIAGLAMVLAIIVISFAGGFTGAKVESAEANAAQVFTVHNIFLPHVAEEMDDYNWWAINESGDKVLLQFCPHRGIKPPFGEGETIWIRYRRVGDCLELLGADAERDDDNNVVRR